MLRFALIFSLLLTTVAVGVEKPSPVVYYPAKVSGPLPVAVWLHGYRAFPSILEDKEYFQRVADQLNVAIIGIPGTTLLDDGTPVWSEEPAADHAYIQEVIGRLANKRQLDMKRVALFGFSEGAMVAADIAIIYPDAYQGAIIMSPGGITGPKARTRDPEQNKKQKFLIFCGAKEHPGNVALANAYAQFLGKLKCEVVEKLDPNQDKHTRPADFQAHFPDWISSILQLPKPATQPAMK